MADTQPAEREPADWLSALGKIWPRRGEVAPSPSPALPLGAWAGLLLQELQVADWVGCSGAPVPPAAALHAATRPEEVVSRATGAALSGARVAALVSGQGAFEALLGACRRALPALFVRGGETGEEAARQQAMLLEAWAGAGLVACPSSAQGAIDSALVLRRAAEQALAPGLLCLDGPSSSWAPRPVALLPSAPLRAYLGAAGDAIASPTPAQQMLFGPERRRVPRWVDPSRPRGLALPLAADDVDAAVRSRDRYFDAALPRFVREASDALAALTGRVAPLVRQLGERSAPAVVVVAGAAAELVDAVREGLQHSEGLRVRVVCLEWLRPFPHKALLRALAGAKRVVVLERGAAPGPQAWLCRQVRSSALGEGFGIASATFGPSRELPRPVDVRALMRRLAAGRLGEATHLGVPELLSSPQLDRQALAERLQRSYPPGPDAPDVLAEAEEEATPEAAGVSSAGADLAPASAGAVLPPGQHVVEVSLGRLAPPVDLLQSWAQSLLGEGEAWPHTRLASLGSGGWCVRLAWGPRALLRSASDAGVDVLVVRDALDPDLDEALRRVRRGGCVALYAPSSLELALPAGLGRAELAGSVRVVAFGGDLSEQLRGSLQLAAGRLAPPGCRDVTAALRAAARSPEPGGAAWRAPAPPSPAARGEGAAALPLDGRHHLWTESLAARRGGAPAVPEPRLALAAAPARSSGLGGPRRLPARVPRIDPAACTACGICWSACPDGSLLPAALSTASLLGATFDAVAPPAERSPAASKLGRGLRSMAVLVNRQLTEGGGTALDASVLDRAGQALLAQLGLGEAETPAARSRLAALRAALLELGPIASKPLFHDAEARAAGSGALLALLRDPRSCQGCGVCAQECPERAIEMRPADASERERMQRGVEWWGRLPDTPVATRSAAAESGAIGPLGAALLSRRALRSLQPSGAGAGTEPGSGARLAAQLLCAQLHDAMADERRAWWARVGQLAEALPAAVRAQLAAAVDTGDLESLQASLREVPDHPDNLPSLVERLAAHGRRGSFDATLAERRVAAARELRRQLAARSDDEVADGPRAVMVVSRGCALESALRYPDNPSAVPLLVEAADAALTVATGLWQQALGEARRAAEALRVAERLAAAASDWRQQLEAAGDAPLSASERALVPTPVVFLGPESLRGAGLSRLCEALSASAPLRVVLLDDRPLAALDPQPSLLGLSLQSAFVSAVSLAHPAHLAESWSAALRFDGPALLQVWCPSPRRHGFDPSELLAQARRAVEARALPLLRYEPRDGRAFGECLDLSGNPAPSAARVARLAAARFATLEQWAHSQPSARERLREQITAELEPRRASERAELEAGHAERLRALRAELEQTHLQRIHTRLLSLAGLPVGPRGAAGEEEPS